ncbi:MAG: nuclear transport factor 2 family protein [Deltaproteobacteria bacterium]|nr:nuclear transport factor 2 family protein [Deltaproteobacteria bacterium]MBW2386420.1 nuclear transport factor 2 family protein [Deltaproteobacteria bacterium]MBW2696380.1 nuclear transport factor 2 family protein [Deltaproteobacteria bacterium]
MNLVTRFQEYADAFEETYEDDDWSRLEPYFTEAAIYEILADPPFASRTEGREKVFAALKQSVDSTDRRFDTRGLDILEGPDLRDGDVWMRWRVRYEREGTPGLVIDGTSNAHFEGDRIALLSDSFDPDSQQGILTFLGEYGAKLKPA